MAMIANNADVYAASRQNIFFPAHNQTPADGNLTGQCVTLNKWFLAEMTEVPVPFKARGHARYVGDQLVAEGHARIVPTSQRKRGDFVVYKNGIYGHIGVLLSGDRIFEQNVNVPGVATKMVDGERVYASRIGNLWETWRTTPTFYRINSYNETGDNVSTVATKDMVDSLAHAYLNDSVANNPGLSFYIGQPVEKVIEAFNGSEQRAKYLKWLETVQWIADTRGERIDVIAQKLDVENEDQYETILANIDKLKAAATGDSFEVVTETLFKKKAK